MSQASTYSPAVNEHSAHQLHDRRLPNQILPRPYHPHFPLQHPPQPHQRPPNHPMLANGDWQRSWRRRLRLSRSWRRRGRGWKPLRLIARDSGRSKSHCSDCILEWCFAIVFNSLLKGSRYAFTRICNLKKLTECFINSREVLPFVWLSLRGMSPCFSLQIERGRSVIVWNI